MSITQVLTSANERALILERDDAVQGVSTDMAWAAGLFEGEGCITLHKKRTGRHLMVLLVVSTDLDVLERFHSIVGVGTIVARTKEQKHHKQGWMWKVSGKEAVRLAACEPFSSQFGTRRSQRLAEVLAEVTSYPPPYGPRKSVTHCPSGHEYTEENTYLYRGFRYCRACRRVREEKRRRSLREG